MFCVWTETADGAECRHCGRPKPASSNGRVVRECSVAGICERRTERAGCVKVQCCGGRERDEPAFVCQRFGRCLPNYSPQGEQLREWRLRQPEASIYHLCHGCESFRPVAAAT